MPVKEKSKPSIYLPIDPDLVRTFQAKIIYLFIFSICLFFIGAQIGGEQSAAPRQSRPTPAPAEIITPVDESCTKSDTGQKMSFIKASEIALKSECVKQGSLKETHFCNESTGTWWIDLDPQKEYQKEYCNPACVVDIATQKAEINWRCTGAKFVTPGEDQKVLCQGPRPEVCTMECVAQPPYICGSDGKSYCNKCSACASSKVEWYITQDNPCEGEFCGGIAGVKCPPGYRCQLEGNYPDAGGKCVRD